MNAEIAELAFWIAHLPLMILFLGGMWIVFANWLRGSVGGRAHASRGRKVGTLVRAVLTTVFSSRVLLVIKTFITEAWFNRRLFRNSVWRWLSHFLLLSGFMLLMTLSGISAVSDKVLIHFFHLEHVPWIGMWVAPDHPVTALLNDIGGSLMTVGFLFFVIRRYFFRVSQLRTGPMDTWMVVGLGLILLSGWVAEIGRLNSARVGPTAYFAFVGYPLALLFKGLPVSWDSFEAWMYLIHGLFTSAVIVSIPYSKFIHVIAGALVAMIRRMEEEEGSMQGGLETGAANVRLDLERFTFVQLMELDACTRCGECIEWCPTFAEKPQRDAITPLRKIEAVRGFVNQQYGLWARILGARSIDEEAVATHSAGTYDCTLCGRCAAVCPVNIDTRSLWISMREGLVDEGVYPETFDNLRETVTTHHNISGDVNEDRLIWSQNLPQVPDGVGGKEQAELVYFVGCVASFYPRSYSLPQSFVEVLDRAEMDFMTLGGKEWCCGFPLIIAGMGDAVVEAVRHNVEAVRKAGAKRLVASCPSCYHTWKHDYPHILGERLGFEVVHAAEMLRDIIGEGRIRLKPLERTVTYHDPCDLGRTSGVYEAPRDVIRAIPGVVFVEMEHHHEYSLCCGGGGDLEMADKDLTAAVAQRRIEEAKATEAKVIVSACQQCERTLAGAARRERIRVRVMDIAELVARQME